MSVLRDGHLVIEPPTPLAVPAEKVINQALNDLAKCPGLRRDGILERVVPLRPGIFLANWGGRPQYSPARREGGGDRGTQLARELGNSLFDIDYLASDRLR